MFLKINNFVRENVSLKVVSVFLAMVFLSVSVSAFHRSIMKGSIVAVEDDTIYICIGSEDGAKVGQKLDVYNIKIIRSDNVNPRLRMWSKKIIRDKIGTVQVSNIIDEHFSTAKIISGEANVHDVVEFKTMVK